jgi:transposase
VQVRKKNEGNQAIGKSKGGLSTKIHAVTDALGNPSDFVLTPGEAHDLAGADYLLPKLQSKMLLADRAYDADERVMEVLNHMGIIPVIPPKRNRQVKRFYDKYIYAARHLIENFFAKLKQYRAIATRYDKLARNFLSGIYLAASVIWLV